MAEEVPKYDLKDADRRGSLTGVAEGLAGEEDVSDSQGGMQTLASWQSYNFNLHSTAVTSGRSSLCIRTTSGSVRREDDILFAGHLESM